MNLSRVSSPLGTILLVTEGDTLRVLDFADFEDRMLRLLGRHYGSVELVETPAAPTLCQALEAYFEGELDALATLPTATEGTPFQRMVWAALRTIPPGETRSYGELAKACGKAGASRAVGLANGANPIAIAVPCHRVVGADGSLTGFGGGLSRKRWLLAHEAQHAGTRLSQCGQQRLI